MKEFGIETSNSKSVLTYDGNPLVYGAANIESESKEIIQSIEHDLSANFENYTFIDEGETTRITGHVPLLSPLRFMTHSPPKPTLKEKNQFSYALYGDRFLYNYNIFQVTKGCGPENIEFEGTAELDHHSTTPHWWWAGSTAHYYSGRWAGYSNVDGCLRFAHESTDIRFSGIFDKFMLGREELFKSEFDPEQEAEIDNGRKEISLKDLPPIIAEQINVKFRKTHGWDYPYDDYEPFSRPIGYIKDSCMDQMQENYLSPARESIQQILNGDEYNYLTALSKNLYHLGVFLNWHASGDDRNKFGKLLTIYHNSNLRKEIYQSFPQLKDTTIQSKWDLDKNTLEIDELILPADFFTSVAVSKLECELKKLSAGQVRFLSILIELIGRKSFILPFLFVTQRIDEEDFLKACSGFNRKLIYQATPEYEANLPARTPAIADPPLLSTEDWTDERFRDTSLEIIDTDGLSDYPVIFQREHFYNEDKPVSVEGIAWKAIFLDEKWVYREYQSQVRRLNINNKNYNIVSTLSELKSRILRGEDKKTEFKETFNLDVRTQTKEKHIVEACIKSVAGFLNSEGGELFIGVKDDGEILGINKEVDLFFKNNDKFKLHFFHVMKKEFKEKISTLIEYSIIEEKGKDVLVINCTRSEVPIFINNDQDFYIRADPLSQILKGRDVVEYINHRFPKLT